MLTNAFQVALISCCIIVLPILAKSGAPINGVIPCLTDEVLKKQLQRNPKLRAKMEEIQQHWRRNPNYGGHVGNRRHIGNRRRLQATVAPTSDPTDFPSPDPTKFPSKSPTPPTTAPITTAPTPATTSPTTAPTTPTRSPMIPYDLPIPFEIPINFHIVSDINIGYERIISQIRVLNLDFNKLNSDVTQGDHEFASRVGNYNIKFSLNNIYRVTNTPTISFPSNNDVKFASTGGSDSVNPQYILNVWVCNLRNNALGWTYRPGVAWNIDGVVLDRMVFGSIAYHHQGPYWQFNSRYDLGRTATHEFGHWLNLMHIWGPNNGGCSYDDYVSDTPTDNGPNYNCPTGVISSCGSHDMYMNFMDYADDNCANMFTVGQVDRSDDLFLAGGYRQDMVDYYHNPTDVTFVSYFYFVYGPLGGQCDAGHTRRNLNLNKGTVGDAIYLCVAYSNNPHMDVITDVFIVSADRSSSMLELIFLTSCPSDYIKIDTDANKGTVGGDYMFACFKKQSQSSAPTRIITDLDAFEFDHAYSGSIQGYTLVAKNLNTNAGTNDPLLGLIDYPYIYLGYKHVVSLHSFIWGLLDSDACHEINDKSICLLSKDNRNHRLNEPCVWCNGGPCTTNNNNQCEPVEWLFGNRNIQLNRDQYEVAHILSGLIPRACYQITDKLTCLSSKDNRDYRLNEPCVWCNGPCTSDNNNECEPAGWLFEHSYQINPGQYEVAVDGYFHLQNRLSTNCIHSSTDGRFSYGACVNAYFDQLWTKDDLNGEYFRVKNYLSGKCLVNRYVQEDVTYTTSPDVYGTVGGNSVYVFHDAGCTNFDDEYWYIDGNFAGIYFMIRNKRTDLCIYQSPDGRFGISICNPNNKDQHWRAIPYDAAATLTEIPPVGDIPFRERWSNIFSKTPNTSGSETFLLMVVVFALSIIINVICSYHHCCKRKDVDEYKNVSLDNIDQYDTESPLKV